MFARRAFSIRFPFSLQSFAADHRVKRQHAHRCVFPSGLLSSLLFFLHRLSLSHFMGREALRHWLWACITISHKPLITAKSVSHIWAFSLTDNL